MFSFFWIRTASVWLSILYILLGLPLLIFPEMSGTVFCWGLSGGAIVYAISHFWRYFQARKENYSSKGDLTLGILFIAIGLFCLFNPPLILSFLPLALGLLLLFDVIGKLPLAIDAKRQNNSMFWMLLISSLLPLLLGILFIINPFGAAKVVIMFFGISLIADGICDFVAAITSKKINKAQKNNENTKENKK